MQDEPQKRPPRIRDIPFSPDVNPLVTPQEIEIKRRHISTGLKQDLAHPVTGEIIGSSVIREVIEKDDAEFVKVFAAGVSAVYDLSRTGQRVFQAVLAEYERTPMAGGFADAVYLVWFDGGLSGRSLGMSESTFNRGMRELLDKGFLAPRTPGVYWVNPALFFKGDRVAFVKEYRRRVASADEKDRAKLESHGQG